MRNPGQRSSSKSWRQRSKSRAMLDRANGLVDGDKYVAPVYTCAELSARFEGSRVGAILTGELHGETMLPRDAHTLAHTRLLGVVERDGNIGDFVDIEDAGFSLRRADFASGEWVFVLASGTECFKQALRG